MDIHGGKGICLGPSNYLGRGYQGVPVAITVEGANILTRNLMIYGQGAIRCHPYVLEEMLASAETTRHGLNRFDKALWGHIGFGMSNFIRSLYFGLGGWHFSNTPFKDSTAIYYKQMNRFSANLALLSDVAMATLGGSLKRKQRISARLGDMLSYLFIASATLKRFDDEGRQKDDLPLLHWAMQDTLYRLQESQLALLDNFGTVGKVMKAIMYPFGRIAKRPSDKLDSKVAKILLEPSATRERLGHGQFLSTEGQFGYLEQTLQDIIAAEPLFDKVRKAANDRRMPFMFLDQVAEQGKRLGVLDDDEIDVLRRAEQGRLRVISVDDFAHEDLIAGRHAREVALAAVK